MREAIKIERPQTRTTHNIPQNIRDIHPSSLEATLKIFPPPRPTLRCEFYNLGFLQEYIITHKHVAINVHAHLPANHISPDDTSCAAAVDGVEAVAEV
eukprot:CAMPEP_0182511644 /NCGR_PEP_ID=MMETSP1321-20130603/30823_1 /TAXON_ID=91990 /ORGANISM="Bolidomonas sp., Strain RCC1657" /LENGTH=97 /DNA_ID=CAMNT_0024718333 /DNA_START=1062 /DNA_END=1355 /DNA_ORIENTATION=+